MTGIVFLLFYLFVFHDRNVFFTILAVCVPLHDFVSSFCVP